ncbi:putative HTH-type transcriptional regulator YdfH [Lentilactobacillus parabuchneri]|jgi:DNA-binding GntR family transcriptional regulator|uniref:Transcriptional regulator, GntR family n=3 Tax=Lentilactobacillus parabuchneri TaxID=152331 RepID=A0A0R1YV70_9LACO|nr:GntR family transcriptional regulator [Lentilactobacillus parabuchneri]APR06548.1 putative HTH-type transcriptional regulator YdfH [Lentilactobacillus parabuchneri]KRM46487.1 transcriptional regulator, GntR family [Lentilactobacillus parabuchneri DSM 5707 = NBRC 107865]KRN79389.1 transcriptional regulator, GntR family [Lentilactobacillus parabuchneri]MBW0223301.1 GntR family transcriptional regulator [Lentilactobacillus parabuchneri]MBW0246228.1 GntR family transcriptional regulator [Lentil
MQSLNEVAYESILNDILKLKFLPGEKIQDKTLMEQLNISRTPIREAILRLKNDGLMMTVPQSGTYVTKISLSSALNARFVRQSVERSVVSEAAGKMSKLDLLDSRTIISKQQIAAEEQNAVDFFYLDNDFHKLFYAATDRLQVWDWLENLSLQLDRYRFLRIQQTNMPLDELIKQHTEILDAVEAHDIKVAEKKAFNHLNLMLSEKDKLIAQFPDYFEAEQK